MCVYACGNEGWLQTGDCRSRRNDILCNISFQNENGIGH